MPAPMLDRGLEAIEVNPPRPPGLRLVTYLRFEGPVMNVWEQRVACARRLTPLGWA